MNHLQTFNHEIFGELPVVIINETEWFGASEAAKALTFSNPRAAIISHVDDEDVTVHDALTNSGTQKKKFINESGLYSLIFGASRQGNNKQIKERAKTFKRWVTSDVLPTIRKTGGYVQNDRAIDFVNSWLPQLDDHSKHAVASTLEQNRHLVNENKELVTKIEKQKPYVSFAETCMTSEKSLLVRELAKLCTKQGVVTGEKRLWQKLRDWKLVFKNKNEPYQEYVERGYFEIAQGVKETSKGSFTWLTMRVKPKGQAYIIDRLKKESEKLKEVQ